MIYSFKKEAIRYLRIWWKLTTSSFKTAFMSRVGAVIFMLGKLLRFVFIFFFLIVLMEKTTVLAQYNLNQVIIFFLTFTVIDTITQLLFREVYRFRPKVISGDFDLILTKPLSPLFRALLGGADPLDLLMIIPYVLILTYYIFQLDNLAVYNVLLYVFLLINGLVIAASFHILVLALGIITTEVDHTIMIYRDISAMTRFPVDIYKEPLRSLITFVIPVGVMISFPAKVLFGALSIRFVIISLVIGSVFLLGSLKLWKFALMCYTSASS